MSGGLQMAKDNTETQLTNALCCPFLIGFNCARSSVLESYGNRSELYVHSIVVESTSVKDISNPI